MGFRTKVEEYDFSGFVSPQISENGGMVLISTKGRGDKPVLCQSENDVIKHFGNPSADNPSVFEAIAYCRQAPAYISSAIGDSALFGGTSIKEDAIASLASGVSSVDDYSFTDNTISHILFTSSQWNSNLYVDIITQGGTKFKANLYELNGSTYSLLRTYDYSLAREKDNFKTSLYYEDVFNDDPYIIPKVNADTTAADYSTLSGTAKYNLDGGARGDTPSSANITTAWNLYQAANKYPITNFMDVFGDHVGDLNTLIQTYQPYAQGMSIIPKGKTVAQMVTYRNSLGIDSDDVCLYAGWTKIVDSYNNSFAWISNIGSIGRKWAMMSDVFDGLSPAGIDEQLGRFSHGGQMSDWTPVEPERDFSDGDNGDLYTLDNAQINPIIKDEIYGNMAYGDKTLQVSLSDTSYIGTRRLYKLIQKTIVRQILRKQEFKNNDEYHRFKAKAMTEDFLKPIIALQLFRETRVVCDETNNDNVALEQRKFYLTLYVKITPNSQEVTLQFIRLSQTQTIAEFLG